MFEGTRQRSAKVSLIIVSVLHNHSNLHAQLRALCVHSNSELTQASSCLSKDFIEGAALVWQQIHFHESDLNGIFLCKPSKKSQFVAGLRRKVTMTDQEAEDLLVELDKYVTFPDFLELLQQCWIERYKRGEALATAPKPIPVPVSWFLFLQGEREMIMSVRSKKKKFVFLSGDGKSTVKPLFYIVNATAKKKFSGVVSIYKTPILDDGYANQWTSELEDGWSLKVVRKMESTDASLGTPQKKTWMHFWGGTQWIVGIRYELRYVLVDNGKEYDESDEPFCVRGGSRFITVQHSR